MKINFIKGTKMESLLHKIRFCYNELGPAEKKVAEYILQNTESILTVNINELAEICGCGAATVVRFSRRLGFDGYQGLKLGFAGELNSASSISSEIEANDSCIDIFRKRINDIAVTLWNTESVLDARSLDIATEKIMKAQRIAIFGLGNSASIAQDAAHKFLRLGLNAQACCDNHMQAIIASHLDRNSVAIGISHSGASKDIIDALRISKVSGAYTICITNYSHSPVVKNSDLSIFTRADETQHSILAMSSRIAQLAIFDAIYTYIVVNSDKSSLNAIYNTEYALQNKKITDEKK